MRVARPDRYEQLLEAAAAAYADNGYHQTTVKAIAERAGVATGTYYLYFPNKEASVLAIIDRLYQLVLTSIIDARRGKATELEKLAASIVAAVRSFGQYEQLAKVVLIQAPGAAAVFDRRLREIQNDLVTLLAENLQEAMAAGLVIEQDARIAARCMIGSLYEVLIAWLRDRDPADLEAALPALVAYNLRGIGAASMEGVPCGSA